ncbi:hypothetical protein MOBT1_001859 [Malassezia obtusa]|uniref:Uncharacterized protein n=1 Tax=Malassezia obtusa TaxID=76774 RepID=A0AAF0IS36_9BASI|nr:hypothetical protein MOBT1_001859 [Malassezia obtusa]
MAARCSTPPIPQRYAPRELARSARLGAVRDALARLSAENVAPLQTSVDALRAELARARPAPDAPVYGELHAMVFGCVRRLLRAGDARGAAEALHALAALAPRARLCAKHRALALRVLGDVRAFPAAWRAVRRLVPDVAPSETTHAVRALLRANGVGAACRVLQWHVRRFWREDAPPPSFALMHNLMIQMRYVAARIDTAPPPLQASYTEALMHLGALLRENRLPLPGAREDVAWLIKLLYTYDARWAPATQRRAVRVIQTALPMYVQRLPADGARTPSLSAPAYNALVQYTLHYAQNPHWCRGVLEHMTHTRTPPLPPSPALVTILLRQATRRRLAALGAFALELHTPRAPHAPERSGARLLQHVEGAVADGDTHRLVALLQYITALRLRGAARADGVRAASVARRVLPALGRRRTRAAPPHADVSAAVLTLAAKAGKIGLALRIWRWMKQRSAREPISVPAATVLMQMLAEAVRKPRATLPRWAARRNVRRRGPHEVRLLALEEYAFLLRHWCAAAHAPPDVRFFRPLLRILRRTTHPNDVAFARILADMAVLGYPPRRHTPPRRSED